MYTAKLRGASLGDQGKNTQTQQRHSRQKRQETHRCRAAPAPSSPKHSPMDLDALADGLAEGLADALAEALAEGVVISAPPETVTLAVI